MLFHPFEELQYCGASSSNAIQIQYIHICNTNSSNIRSEAVLRKASHPFHTEKASDCQGLAQHTHLYPLPGGSSPVSYWAPHHPQTQLLRDSPLWDPAGKQVREHRCEQCQEVCLQRNPAEDALKGKVKSCLNGMRRQQDTATIPSVSAQGNLSQPS